MILQLVVGIIVVIIILASLITMFKFRKDIQKMDITANMPIVENDFRTEFTEGYSIGVIKSQIPCKNETTRIEYYPIDVEQGENIQRPSIQVVIVKNDLIKRFASGRLSSRRERIKLIDRNTSKIPDELRDTTEGKWITKEGQLGYLKSIFNPAISYGDEAIAEAMKTYARGNVAKSTLATLKEENEKFRKLKLEQPPIDEKKK